jgi:hypothetical protein
MVCLARAVTPGATGFRYYFAWGLIDPLRRKYETGSVE